MFPGGMNNMMKQVQKLQKQLLETQERIAEMTVEASAGGGAVKVVVSGRKELKSITIAPEVVDPDDVEMLQDLIVAAVNEGMKKAEEMAEAEMKKLLPGGMPKIPGLFG
ncbi:MAG: YbaB/EbfC family nucleoid-associated protein [Bacillota bacterium]|nr:MAG: YbaB/EbfC family nucleoid-associated protein [Bacillota bacterium]